VFILGLNLTRSLIADAELQVELTCQRLRDASSQPPVNGEPMTRYPNRKICIPKRYPAALTRIEQARSGPYLPGERFAYTYRQAADVLQVSVSMIKRCIDEGSLKVIMIGSRPRIPRASIQRLLDES
jgi:excisionase family DNA binding protein